MRTSAFLLSASITILGCGIALNLSQPPAVSAGSEAKARGAELFATRGCVHCHGAAGVGGDRGPDLQLVRKRLRAEKIAHQIHDGGGGMPAYGDQLSSPEIDDLVAYLRAKRKFVVVLHPSAAPAAKDPTE